MRLSTEFKILRVKWWNSPLYSVLLLWEKQHFFKFNEFNTVLCFANVGKGTFFNDNKVQSHKPL